MTQIISFSEALENTSEIERSVLLGNGFSYEFFNYPNLYEKANFKENDPLRVLFDLLQSNDFEAVINALEGAAIVAKAYNNNIDSMKFTLDADRVREALIHAVREVHPAHKEDISNKIPFCVQFLKNFERIFTLNYDLLLYWVMLDARGFSDGFGLGALANGFKGPWKTDANCNVFNLHGALHLFQSDSGDVEKRVMKATGIIDAIAETILKSKRLPIYIAEGDTQTKLAKIKSVPYLFNCFNKLKNNGGVLFVFGHSAKQNDLHIYNAIFQSDIDAIYFCVHNPSENLTEIKAELDRYKTLNKSNKIITYVDSKTANVWG